MIYSNGKRIYDNDENEQYTTIVPRMSFLEKLSTSAPTLFGLSGVIWSLNNPEIAKVIGSESIGLCIGGALTQMFYDIVDNNRRFKKWYFTKNHRFIEQII